MLAREMISTHPDTKGKPSDALVHCVEECFNCAQTCTACADACLAEPMVDRLRQCIRLNLDCADVCAATGKLASRRTGVKRGPAASHAADVRRGVPRMRRGVPATCQRTRALSGLR